MVAFLLLHSPSVGPSTWRAVADELRRRGHDVAVPDVRAVASAPPPYAARVVQLAADQCGTLAHTTHIAVAHSNAGLFLPALARATGAVAMVFVDASVPPDGGAAEMAPPRFLDELRAKAVDGMLPRWTDWWSADDVATLFADAESRRIVEDEEPRLPLAYYEERVPVPEGWTAIPCAYLVLGPPYTEIAGDARTRGWPVAHVPGEHLHMLGEPRAVTDALLGLAAQLQPAR